MKTQIILRSILLLVFVTCFGAAESQVLKTRQKEYKQALRQRTKELIKEGYSPKVQEMLNYM